jgi:MFS family permease
VRTLERRTAFWLLAVTLAALLFASSVPSPLYVIYQTEWDFSALTLTGVFAVYALALLSALLVTGSLSDHLGRRPVLLAALAVEVGAMLVFALAGSVVWLFAARILQGLATGVAMGCISAALLDLQPEDRQWQGALTGVVAPMSGLAAGAVFAALLADHTANPVGLVFWLLVAVFVAAGAMALLLPETVERGDGWRDSLRLRIGIPPHVRSAFVAALPSMLATWSLGGLVLSLGPSMSAELLGADSHLAAALPIFALAGISAVMSYLVRDLEPRTTARWGLSALITGVVIVLLALSASSSVLFLVGAAVSGLGFGPAFAGIFRALTDMAFEDRRAELVSSVLTAAYLAFSVPALVAGLAVTQFGLRDTVEVYGVTLIVVASTALALTGRLQAVSPRPVTGTSLT